MRLHGTILAKIIVDSARSFKFTYIFLQINLFIKKIHTPRSMLKHDEIIISGTFYQLYKIETRARESDCSPTAFFRGFDVSF